jgi:hypothetical protein
MAAQEAVSQQPVTLVTVLHMPEPAATPASAAESNTILKPDGVYIQTIEPESGDNIQQPVALAPIVLHMPEQTVVPDSGTTQANEYVSQPPQYQPEQTLPAATRAGWQPYQAPEAQKAVALRQLLATHTGLDVGVQASLYKYREQVPIANPFINQWGYKAGAEAALTLADTDWFLRGEGRFAQGTDNYVASNGQEINGIPEHTWEVRGLIGRDFMLNSFILSPYTGYGYRYLWDNNAAGSAGAAGGYRRESRYQYLPLGVTHRFRLMRMPDQARLSTNLEYDYFIGGTQMSMLSDSNPASPNILSPQHIGFGARGSLLYESSDWSFGPWVNYWHIGESETYPVPGPFFGANEPDNKTTEFGLKIVRKIW